MKRAEVRLKGNPEETLAQQGYVKINAGQFVYNPVFAEDFARLRRAAAALPIDHTDKTAGRARQYGRMVHLPWLGADIAVPPRVYTHSGEFGLEYTQPASVNSDSGGQRRIFPALAPALYRNRALTELISLFRSILPLDADARAEAMSVGIHLLKLEAAAGYSAKASPNLVHRDGEPYTVAVLLDRAGAEGGENVITQTRWHDHAVEDVPSSDILARFTLERSLEAYVVKDDRVAHYVAPVTCAATSPSGVRTILLLDYTPLRPVIVMTGMEEQAAA